MDIITIAIYIVCFATGFGVFWLISRNGLMKDIKAKEHESGQIIVTANNKSLKIIKEAEKKAKQFKSSQMKKAKEEAETIKEALVGQEKILLEKERNLNTSQIELTRKEAQLELKEQACNETELKYRTKEDELDAILEDAKLKIENIQF